MRRTRPQILLVTVAVAAVQLLFMPAVAHTEDTDAMLTRYITGLNAGMPPHTNGAAVSALFAEDGAHYQPFGEPPGGPFRGRAAIAQFFDGFDELFADWTHVERSRTIQGNRAVWEGLAQGTHKETGKLLKLPIVFLLDFDNQGKVKEKRVYVDIHLVGEQVK